ncbi:MAG: NAD(P)-binding protein [Proteobacteria bacterium]|nr:NAD(P)-binding protein [Pseudomonadota bacterium]
MNMLSRRTALKAGILIAGQFLAAPKGLYATVNAGASDKEGKIVAVIGAGIAGLAAARRLSSKGYEVIVVEGRDRPGGRIWTDHSLGTPVDLGAAWIHGDSSQNPLMKIAHQYGLSTQVTDWEETWLFDIGYGEIEDDTYEEIQRKAESILEGIYDRQQHAGNHRSMVDALAPIFKNLSGNPIVKRGIRWWLASQIETEYASDFGDLSFKHWDMDEKYSGDDVVVHGGYSQIIDRMADGLNIKYGHVVNKISQSVDGAMIATNQGVIQCDRAVVTLPLGVLKQGRVKFEPGLTDEKVTSIGRLGMGTMNKIALRFAKPFWPEDAYRLGLFNSSTENLIEYFPMTPYSGEPVIVGLTRGRHARSLETAKKEDVVQQALTDLKFMFGSGAPTSAVESVVTAWHSDEFSGGAYSHVAPGASFTDYRTLAKPFGERIFFAGEATHATYPGTAHGAFLSGERVAKEIANLQGSNIGADEANEDNR